MVCDSVPPHSSFMSLLLQLHISQQQTSSQHSHLHRQNMQQVATCMSLLLLSSTTAAFRPNLVNPSRSAITARHMFNLADLLGAKSSMVTPEKALPGRKQPMPVGNHYLWKSHKLEDVPEGHDVAVYGSGCFWGSEKGQWRFPKGIYSTAVGYCAGFTKNPTYEEACSGMTGHTEGVRVVYDPTQVSLTDILRWFWESHDPTSGMGQGNDRGTQYRSGFYYFNDDQKQLIEASKTAYEQALSKASGTDRTITTEIKAASDYDQYGGLWYFAEDYHQQYLAKPMARPYCSAQPQGVSLPDYETWCPFDDEERREKYKPTLPESFWKNHGPRRGCSVVSQDNEPISETSY